MTLIPHPVEGPDAEVDHDADDDDDEGYGDDDVRGGNYGHLTAHIPHPVEGPDAEVDHDADDDDDEGYGDDDVRGGNYDDEDDEGDGGDDVRGGGYGHLAAHVIDHQRNQHYICNIKCHLPIPHPVERPDAEVAHDADDDDDEGDDGDDDDDDDGEDGHLTAHIPHPVERPDAEVDHDADDDNDEGDGGDDVRGREGYLADEEIADVAAHREADDAQVEQDDGDDEGNDDGGDGRVGRGGNTLDVSCQLGDQWDLDYDVCANKLLRLAVERDAEGYLAYEKIADVAAHRESEYAQVEQDDGDDHGNDDGGDGFRGKRKRRAGGRLRIAVFGTRRILLTGFKMLRIGGRIGRVLTGERLGGDRITTDSNHTVETLHIQYHTYTDPPKPSSPSPPSPLNLQTYQSPSNALTNCNTYHCRYHSPQPASISIT
ncbi:hypothetical protein BBBOND_0111380 [Babesia bigemina]|uniref:Uncharacterized protein n=1 Tax=Babesia bigemina TaxID=5866 RepID=A0A061DAV7_BABBI|nr:hypothetical protein BBBOND_0111380 [Babesia bigemina]CDR94840.1 hypothetical protein BBBOND_0111380 [Babesia bigemina]|eukprot:XP_012767026.1 hypothetical protein BBBOND_0111380 [Babesia bigemina]